MTELETLAHSDLPPSASDKWLNCHAWFRLTRGLKPKSSPAAEEGTLAHRYFEEHLNGIQSLDALDNNEMQDALLSCTEWVEDQVEEVDGELYTELRIDFGEKFGYAGLTGTADVIVVSEQEILIADLKYGVMPVEVEENTQLLTYLVGAIHRFGPRESYRVAILQPRARHAKGPIRVWRVSEKRVAEFEQQLKAAIHGNYNEGPAAVGPHCRNYCLAAPVCPALAEHSLRLFRETPIED